MAAAPAPRFPLRLDRLPAQASAPADGSRAAPRAPSPPAVLRPQRPVAQAHASAAQPAMAASGLGLDSADVRRRLAQRLRAAGLADERVLGALAAVPRHAFVDAGLVTQAYEDTSLPIGHGQTISKPSVVGRMLELLFAGANARRDASLGKALEIGTGCGYQAALLALLARHVYSIERLKPLHDKARDLLAPLRPANLRLIYGDGMLGHGPNAPYDSIVAAAGGDVLPPCWLDQMAVGGRLVAPLRDPVTRRQALVVVDRHETGWTRTVHEGVHFVPLKSGLQ